MRNKLTDEKQVSKCARAVSHSSGTISTFGLRSELSKADRRSVRVPIINPPDQ